MCIYIYICAIVRHDRFTGNFAESEGLSKMSGAQLRRGRQRGLPEKLRVARKPWADFSKEAGLLHFSQQACCWLLAITYRIVLACSYVLLLRPMLLKLLV